MRAFVFPGPGRPGGRHGARARLGLSGRPAPSSTRSTPRSGEKLSALIWDGDIGELTLTRNAQPALMATSIAAMRALQAEGVAVSSAAFVAGHSLGEYSALCAAGAMRLDDTARMLRLRGQAMQEAVPVGRGAMAAILGLDLAAVEAVAAEAAAGRGVRGGQRQRPGAGGGFWRQGGGRAGGGDRQGAGRQAGADAAGERAVPLRADAAGGRPDGGGACGGEDRDAGGAARGQHHRRACPRRGDHPGAAGAAGDRTGALAGERALDGGPRRHRDGGGGRGQGALRDDPAGRQGRRDEGGGYAGRGPCAGGGGAE